MADMDQLDGLMDALEVTPGMSMLDFGCGDGRISEYLSDRYQLCMTGVDIAEGAIQLALDRTQTKRGGLRYFSANIEKSPESFPTASFDRVIAIDSIFFTRNLLAVLSALLSSLRPDGKMGVFFIAPPETAADGTPLAFAMKEMGLLFSTLDFTQQNRAHWEKKKSILKQLEAGFIEEGSQFLYKNRMAECQGNLDQFQRYLYLISKN
jgi:cyclopropane fatty-acyl-phospholipid synthase-like methyltransferase